MTLQKLLMTCDFNNLCMSSQLVQ